MLSRGMVTGAAALVLCAGAVASPTGTPIALTGHDDAQGPGEGAGVHFGVGVNGTLGSASACINLNGDVVFRRDDVSPANEGVWFHPAGGGANYAIALSYWSVGDYYYLNGGFNFPLVNNAGQTAWRYSSTASRDNGSGPAVTATTTRHREHLYRAPDTGDATINSFALPAPIMNSAGDNAFLASLSVGTGDPVVEITPTSTANSYGIWSGPPGATHLRIRQNSCTPGAFRPTTCGSAPLPSRCRTCHSARPGKILVGASLQGTINSTTGSRNDGGPCCCTRRGPACRSSPGGAIRPLERRASFTTGSPPGPTRT